MSGTWALILGCTQGAGGAIASRLLSEGLLDVIGFHRGNHPDAAAALTALAARSGRRCVLIEGDAGRLDTLPQQVERVREALGEEEQLTLLIHACADASIGLVASEDPRAQLHPRQILKTFEVMAHSFLFWGQAVVTGGLMARGGQIIGFPNTLDDKVVRGFCAVSASKAALTAYVRHMSVELAPYGVRVNAVRFGATPTHAFRKMPNFEGIMDQVRRINPMDRTTSPEDVADMVTLMLDRRAAWLNGAVINLDGGEQHGMAEGIFGARP
ncbi:MAG: SDR family oxidoreductase [Alphaproteobacteria bacterium]|nr:SDR family oxidoreductase [Alphaproteobacteria bacterium]